MEDQVAVLPSKARVGTVSKQLTKIYMRAKRLISRVFSLFIKSQSIFCTLPVRRPY